MGDGNIGNQYKTQIKKNVLYVNGLKHNLLSTSQLCDKDMTVSKKPLSIMIVEDD